MRNIPSSLKAFTLVELLVVIGIIALLVSILLPALAQARMSAVNVNCMSNMHQVYIAYTSYTIDNQGWYPLSTQDEWQNAAGYGGGGTWYNTTWGMWGDTQAAQMFLNSWDCAQIYPPLLTPYLGQTNYDSVSGAPSPNSKVGYSSVTVCAGVQSYTDPGAIAGATLMHFAYYTGLSYASIQSPPVVGKMGSLRNNDLAAVGGTPDPTAPQALHFLFACSNLFGSWPSSDFANQNHSEYWAFTNASAFGYVHGAPNPTKYLANGSGGASTCNVMQLDGSVQTVSYSKFPATLQ
jgi:prepilin-type N-terminal cleavage/methylation domain-containing protein